MAGASEHLAQFDHNLGVADRLADSSDFDWAVTAFFYAALHFTQAYLSTRDVIVASHGQRDRVMRNTAELVSILHSYRTLRDESEHARYECRSYSREEYETIRSTHFAMVVDHMRGLTGGN